MSTLTNFQLLSTSFLHEGEIPTKFTCKGADISPALAWSHAPAKTQSFALIVEDRDAPGGRFVHWLVFNLPVTPPGMPEAFPTESQLPDGTLQGKNSFGKIGYTGPCPPGGRPHRYVFKLYALNAMLKCRPAAGWTEVEKSIRQHSLGTAELIGRYEIKQQAEAKAEAEGEAEEPSPAAMQSQAKLKALGENSDYLMKTHKVQEELKKAYSVIPSTVTKFFKTVTFSSNPAAIQEFLKDIGDPDVRRPLEDYLKYANRYGVYFRLKANPLEFEPRAWPQYGVKFRAKVVGDHLEPPELGFVPGEDDSLAEYFAVDDLQVPPAIKKLVDAGEATYFRIDEKDEYSILRQMENIARKDDGVAIIEHHAEQPYFILICGPKMKKQLLAKVGPALTEFQQGHYVDSFGGRPHKLERLKRELDVEKQPISKKAKAIELAGTDEKKLNAQQGRSANLRSRLKKVKP